MRNYYQPPLTRGFKSLIIQKDGAAKDSDGEAHFGYAVLTPLDVYDKIYKQTDVSGIGDNAYFNNGADARQLWVENR